MDAIVFQMTEATANLIGILASLGVSVVIWLIADARYKARIIFLSDELNKSNGEIEKIRLSTGELQISNAKSEQDRVEIHRKMDRLDDTKASKDMVDNFKSEMATLRADIDKRFDRLERLIEKNNE